MTKQKQQNLTNISKEIDPDWDNVKNIDIKESRYLEDKKLHRSLTDIINKQSKQLKILFIIMSILVIGDIAIFAALFMLN